MNDNTESILDEIAIKYHLQEQTDSFIERICQENELEWFSQKLHSSDTLLELGFGDGVTFSHLHNKVKLTVIEGSQEIVKHSQKLIASLNSSATIVRGLFENFEPDEQFDWVFASHVLEHVDDPMKILNRMKKWIKHNGKIVVIVPNQESMHRKLALQMGIISTLDELSPRDLVVGHQRVYNKETLENQFLESGYSIIEKRGFFIKPFSNSQLINFGPEIITGLCKISADLPMEMCANLAYVISKVHNE